jgi:poly(A) polymerase
MAALEAAGGPDCARFVGGCVRNALIGAPVADIDIATTLEPEETDRAIRAAGLKAVPTGIAHGTVTAVSAGWVLSTAGQVIAFVPNELGKALLHNERITR